MMYQRASSVRHGGLFPIRVKVIVADDDEDAVGRVCCDRKDRW